MIQVIIENDVLKQYILAEDKIGVIIPDSVKSIGAKAINGYTGLT
jgi:hypothetical protein